MVKVEDDILKAYVTVVFDKFCLWDVKVISRRGGLDVVLPTKKKKAGGKTMHYPYIKFIPGEWDSIKKAVLAEYEK
jgi:DNA-binding cell septation regulator SpoVG